MQGLTLEKVESMGDAYEITVLVGAAPRPFLSLEPLLGMVFFNPSFSVMEKIIVGCDSNKGAARPLPEWIQSVKEHVPAEKVFWKSNIEKYL
jgi:protein gp37